MPTDINFNKSLGFMRTSRVAVQSIKFAPVNVTPPAITGNTTLGSVLHLASVGQWLNYPSSFTYQWQRDGVNIIGATDLAYTLVQADSAAFITCVVTATNITGSASTASNQIKADFYSTVPINSVAPVISGSTALSSVLTTTNGTWTNSPTSFTYQWKRGATNIGTNTNTYTLVAADSGAAITCLVTASNASGSSSPATSNTITAQTYSAPANVGAPVISGSTTLGSVLSSTTGTWNGNPSPTYTYQWKRGATNIGTNSSTYTLVSADSAAAITCVVTATNALGSNNSTSNTITADNYAPVNTVAPVISGSTALGGVLSSTTGTWNGIPTITYAYQWIRGSTDIPSATSSNYTLVAADSAQNITCRVTATNSVGSGNVISNTITAQTYTAPVNTIAPVISGTTTLGSTLSSTTGTFTGNPTPTYAYQWRRNAVNITSATASTYVLVSADSAAAITCVVTATNALGNSSATSNTITADTYAAAFTSTWAVTAGETITLPYEAAGTYSGTIDWGDGGPTSVNDYTTRTHTYVGAGTYTISITGVTTGFRFNNTGSKANIRTITNWGALKLGNNGGYFYGCTNLTLTTVAGTLDLTGTTNLTLMFGDCISITTVNGINSWNTAAVTSMGNLFFSCGQFSSNISSWNTAAVTSMSGMFFGCNAFNQNIGSWNTGAVQGMSQMFFASAFNQNIGSWNVANVTNMSQMFQANSAFNQNLGSWNVANVANFTNFMGDKTPATFSAANLDAIYNGWVTVQSSLNISFGTAQYSAAGATGRNYLTGTKLWTITDGGQQLNPFTSTWQVTAGETITLPYEVAGTYSGTIDWGDSTTSVNSYANRTHTYATAGTKTISITGVTTGFRFNNSGSRLNIRTITNWGTLRLGNSNEYFYGCSNLNLSTVSDVLDLTGTTFFANMFNGCTSLTSVNNINSWSSASVIGAGGMFYGCTNFNQALSFNMSSCVTFTSMFNGCSILNSAITFNTNSATQMSYMFYGCTALNSAITFTSTASVSNMANMFQNCTNFNKAVPFNTAAVTSMSSMFNGCSNFNQAVPFNTTAVTNMSGMFQNCSVFNQPINFTTNAVTNMNAMFGFCSAFNSSITFSSTANVTNMSNMFIVCSVFNQPLTFNTASVTTFYAMFFGCGAFNSLLTFTSTGVGCSTEQMFAAMNVFNTAPIFTSTANITNMSKMFQNNGVYNKPLTFDCSSATNMSEMFTGNTALNSAITLTNTGNVQNMSSMFYNCTNFNQPLTLNTTSVTNMSSMFAFCSAFNSSITFSSTANVTNMTSMFRTCVSFNQPLTFNTTAVTSMQGMFEQCSALNSALTFSSTANVLYFNGMFYACYVFNQPLTFNTIAALNMSQMFTNCTNFNQPLAWNTGAVTNMNEMFNGATAFQQNIGSWNVANVTNFINFMSTKTPATFSTTNLDAIYNGWSASGVKPNINISFGSAKFTNASGLAGKNILLGVPNNWTIADGGGI